MAIPSYQDLMIPVLQCTADGKDHSSREIREIVARAVGLTNNDLEQRLASGQATFTNRIAWSLVYLTKASALTRVGKAVYQITSHGLQLLRSSPQGLRASDLSTTPEFVSFLKGPDPNSSANSGTPVERTPEEQLDASYQVLRSAVTDELLEALKNGSPAAFEQIVVDLLVAMGYGGDLENAGEVVGRSGDGGIDGIVKEDKLGLDAIYVQAKRWQGVVGSPEIARFSGSLMKRHAQRGVFITTSWFSKDALSFVESIPQRIVLIDGRKLASLLIEHNVGVIPDRIYTLKRIDFDYLQSL